MGNTMSIQDRIKWDKRYMELAELVATWSTCYRENRQIGAVIVKNNRILTVGYNGAPSGVQNCFERGECLRNKLNIPSGTKREICYSIDAEQNAIVQAAKLGLNTDGATVYVTHQPCAICARILISAGIKRIVYKHSYPDDFSVSLFKEAGLQIESFDDAINAVEVED